MSTKCSKCKQLIESEFEMEEDLDNYRCPNCGNPLYACTSGIHVHGRDM